MAIKVLFVCTGNSDRSPTAEELVNKVKGIEAKSAGTSSSARMQISKKLIDWADYILLMQDLHKEYIKERWSESENKIKVLNIEDKYSRNSPELIVLLKEKIAKFFPELFHYNDVRLTAWCSRCRDDGCIGRVRFVSEISIDKHLKRIIILYEVRCGRFYLGFEKLPEKLCSRCSKKINERITIYQEKGLPIVYGNPSEWNSQRTDIINIAEMNSNEKDLMEAEKQAQILFDKADDAWRTGLLKEGDAFACQAEDLLSHPIAYSDIPIEVNNDNYREEGWFKDPSNLNISPSLLEEALRKEEGIRAYRKAGCLKDPSNLNIALSFLEEALKKNPYYATYPPYWDRLGHTLERLDRHEEAIQCYRKRIELQPERNNASQWHCIAQSLWNAGKFDAAREIMNDTSKIPPNWYKRTRKKFGLV